MTNCRGSAYAWKGSRTRRLFALTLALALAASAASADDRAAGSGGWEYGITAGLGYFNFRNSLFTEIDPDPPGNLSDDWFEFFARPRVAFEYESGPGTFFGEASWAYARTGSDAADISGGTADSTDFDKLYLGWRTGFGDEGRFEVAAGRYPYQIANGFLISDGYADGGSRGAVWSNPRQAWAPGGKLQFGYSSHDAELFYLERDERPESDSDTRIAGVNYRWRGRGGDLEFGASYWSMDANELAPQRDGAKVWNLRFYGRPFGVPLDIEAEWAEQDNGPALDATSWYVQPYWTWEDAAWQPVLYYRYGYFQGDDPDTPANEDFDPLFPAFHDWGSWWQGEIAGEYFLSNSNAVIQMLRLHATPSATTGTGLLFFDYRLDQPGSYEGGVVSSDLGWEIDWYLDWQARRWLTLSFVLARAEPGAAVQEAFDRTDPFLYAMVYGTFDF